MKICKLSVINISILRYISAYNPLLFRYLPQQLKIPQFVFFSTGIWNIFWITFG